MTATKGSSITVADNSNFRSGDVVTIFLPTGPITRRVVSVDSATTMTIAEIGRLARLWMRAKRQARSVLRWWRRLRADASQTQPNASGSTEG